MLLTDERPDLIGHGLDVALRLGPLPDSSLVARRLAVLPTRLYASAEYLRRYGEPGHPGELAGHRTLAMSGHRRAGRFIWPLARAGESREFTVNPVLVSNDPAALGAALRQGEGIALASHMSVKPFLAPEHIREVLPDWSGALLELNAVFLKGEVLSPKVRAFIDFLVDTFDFDALQTLAAGRSMVSNPHRASDAAARVEAPLATVSAQGPPRLPAELCVLDAQELKRADHRPVQANRAPR